MDRPVTADLTLGSDEALNRPLADPWRSRQRSEEDDPGLSGFWQDSRFPGTDAYDRNESGGEARGNAGRIRCPLCGAEVEPSGNAMRGLGMAVGVLVVLAFLGVHALRMSGRTAAVLGALLPVLGVVQWLLPLLARIARSRDVPEECPYCHGPLRTALQAEWGAVAWYDSPYMRVRWQPDED